MKKILTIITISFLGIATAQTNFYDNESSKSKLANSAPISIDEIFERQKSIQAIIETNQPVITLLGNDTNALAQNIALSNSLFCKYFIDEKSNKKTLNEIFGVYKILGSNIRFKVNKDATLYRVEMYNYAFNCSSVAIVDITSKSIIEVNHYFQTQPDVPKHLEDLALKLQQTPQK